jgi:hypothetical protein
LDLFSHSSQIEVLGFLVRILRVRRDGRYQKGGQNHLGKKEKVLMYVSAVFSVSGTSSNMKQKLVRGVIIDPTPLTSGRDRTAQTIKLTRWPVELTDGRHVQHGSENFSSAQTQKDVAITDVDTAKSVAVGDYMRGGGKSPHL